MNTRIAFVIITLGLGVSSTQAMPPLARRTVGTIEKVDLENRQIVIRAESRVEPMRLAFDRRTRIWNNSQAATPSALARGQTVQLSYRLPFFGPDYASRLVLLAQDSEK